MLPAEVRELRRRLGLSQAKMASMMGVTVVTYGNYERGDVVPSHANACLRMIKFICNLGHLPPIDDNAAVPVPVDAATAGDAASAPVVARATIPQTAAGPVAITASTQAVTTSAVTATPAKKAKKTPSARSLASTESDREFAKYIWGRVHEIVPGAVAPSMAKWADDVRLLREKLTRNGLSADTMRETYDWAADDVFWRRNILSPATLDRQWVRLRAEMTKKAGMRRRVPMLVNARLPGGTAVPVKPTTVADLDLMMARRSAGPVQVPVQQKKKDS